MRLYFWQVVSTNQELLSLLTGETESKYPNHYKHLASHLCEDVDKGTQYKG